MNNYIPVKEHVKKSDGYHLISKYTSSHTVEMDNGNTLEEEILSVGKGIELTQAEYDALSEEEKNNGTTYYIKDGDTNLPVNATNINYNNTDSGLSSTNLQDAVDEINNKFTCESIATASITINTDYVNLITNFKIYKMGNIAFVSGAVDFKKQGTNVVIATNLPIKTLETLAEVPAVTWGDNVGSGPNTTAFLRFRGNQLEMVGNNVLTGIAYVFNGAFPIQ